MPTPRADETQDEFSARCIPVVLDEGVIAADGAHREVTDQGEAFAICASMWESAQKQEDGPTNERDLTEAETLAAVQLNGVKFDKEAADYTDTGGAKPCRGCAFFIPSPDDAKIGACRVVAGTIAAAGHSDYYIAAEEQQGSVNVSKAKEFKTVSGLVISTDEAQGIVDAIFAVMGNLDEGNDVIHPGAFTKTFVERGQKVRIVDQHLTDSVLRSLGKPLEMREMGRDELPTDLVAKYPAAVGAALAKIQFNLKTQNGHDAFQHLAAGDISEWSFGYDPMDVDFSKVMKDGEEVTARNLRTLKLWEISPVLWGMNPATMTASAKEAKADDTEDKGDKAQVPFAQRYKEFLEEYDLPLEMGGEAQEAIMLYLQSKIGRAISKANEKRIMAAIDNIDKGVDGLRTMIEEVLGAPDSPEESGRDGDSEKAKGEAGSETPPTSEDKYADEARERDTLLTELDLLELEIKQ